MKRYYEITNEVPMGWYTFTVWVRIPLAILTGIFRGILSIISQDVIMCALYLIVAVMNSLDEYLMVKKKRSGIWLYFGVDIFIFVLSLISLFLFISWGDESSIYETIGGMIVLVIFGILEGIYYYKRFPAFASNGEERGNEIITYDEPRDETHIYCRYCGADLGTLQYDFCRYCGKKLVTYYVPVKSMQDKAEGVSDAENEIVKEMKEEIPEIPPKTVNEVTEELPEKKQSPSSERMEGEKMSTVNVSKSEMISEREQLLGYKEMLDAGLITQEDYNTKKKQILGI